MGMKRRQRVPEHVGPRPVVVLQMVGVELDEAGDEVVAVDILAGHREARVDRGDRLAVERDGAVDHDVGEDDLCVAKDRLHQTRACESRG